MSFNGTPAESFRQGFSWNPLGDLAFADYPVCTYAGCQPRPAVFADVAIGHGANHRSMKTLGRYGTAAAAVGVFSASYSTTARYRCLWNVR